MATTFASGFCSSGSGYYPQFRGCDCACKASYFLEAHTRARTRGRGEIALPAAPLSPHELHQPSMTATHSCALIAIRERILREQLRSGECVDEARLLAMLGHPSPTLGPVLSLLVQEGLLADVGGRGYVVRSWSEDEVADVIDMRGALEGLAARRVAERGVSPGFLAELRACLREGDAIFERKLLGTEDKATYADMNRRFHALIVEEAGSATILEDLARNNRRPFASPFAVAFGHADPEQVYDVLRYAHRQHYAIINALEHGQGPRADVLMREHVTPAKERLNIRRQRTYAAPQSFIHAKRDIAASG